MDKVLEGRPGLQMLLLANCKTIMVPLFEITLET